MSEAGISFISPSPFQLSMFDFSPMKSTHARIYLDSFVKYVKKSMTLFIDAVSCPVA